MSRPACRMIVAVALLALTACDKPSAPGGESPTREPASSATTVALPASASAAAPSAAAAMETPPPAPSAALSVASATPAPTNPRGAASHATADAGKVPDVVPTVATLKPASKHVAGNHFEIDVASPGCRAATDCVMTINLQPTSGFHVNKEYPYKFTAVATPNVTFLGKGDASVFSRASGDFAEASPTSGVMTVRFKPAGPGEVSLTGTYKLSVCSADQCQIEQQAIALTVTVL